MSDSLTLSRSPKGLEQAINSGSMPEILGQLFPALRKYCPILPEISTPQAFFLLLDCREAFYGGAAGGGKSAALLADALKYVDTPGYAALILRRTYPELEGSEGLIFQALEWLGPTDARWNAEQHRWTFPSGAVLQFGHVKAETDKTNYQGQAYQTVCFDELTHFTETIYDYIAFSRARRRMTLKRAGIPIRARSASNPGGIGHGWVKKRFIDERKEGVVFIPAKVADNPGLDVAEYAESLGNLGETLRAQLLDGDWGAFEGMAYTITDAHIVEPFEIPRQWERFESMDYGINNPTSWQVHAVDYDDNLISFGEWYKPSLPSHTAPMIHALRQIWGSSLCWGDPQSLATRTGTVKAGQPVTIATEFVDLGIPIAKAKNDPRAGYTRMRERIEIDPERRFPDWHPRSGEKGAPSWFFVEKQCPELVKQMREAPLAPIETRYGGEHVDLEWERKDGHAHASARYGVASRFTAPTRPAEEIDDSSVTPQEVRDSYFQQRLEQLEQAELEEFLEV